jgi:hypothetical protein
MKKITFGNRMTPYLLAACVLLAGMLALQSHNMIQSHSNSTPDAQPEIKPLTRENFTAAEIAAFSEITERPLFIAGREPPPEPVAAPSAAAKVSPLRMRLEGVALTPEAKIAVLRDLRSNKVLHLATGMKHQGWELTAVTDTVATFKRGEESEELRLKE